MNYAQRKWAAGQAARDAAQAARYAAQALAPVIDYAAINREKEAAREAYSNRDMTAENLAAEIAKAEAASELARILAIAGVSNRGELMDSVSWASTYLPLERGNDLVVFSGNGETRGIWDKSKKSWEWSWQNFRGNRDDAGSGYGRHTD